MAAYNTSCEVQHIAKLTNLSLAESSSSSPFEYLAPSNLDNFSPSWSCAICLDNIQMEETAQIKGCEHAYCVNCILKWASYKEDDPWCPQCKLPFTSLFVCKGLDGKRSDYMVEESVCLLLRAPWFTSLPEVQEPPEEHDDYNYEDPDYDEEYFYASNLRLGNRRWGDSGYVRAGRREARPITTVRQAEGASESSESGNKGKGRRAKRAQKREAIRNNSNNVR